MYNRLIDQMESKRTAAEIREARANRRKAVMFGSFVVLTGVYFISRSGPWVEVHIHNGQ
jgi:hypothetical protein